MYLFMENNQNRPQRKKMSRIDLIIIALGLLVIWRVDWANMNSFHYLIMFMFLLCLMLRWGNMRKAEEQKRKRAEYMAQKAAMEAAVRAASKEAVVSSEASEEIPVDEAPETTAEEKPTE